MKYILNLLKYISCMFILGFLAISTIMNASGQSKTLGIECDEGKLTNGQCTYNFNAMIGKKEALGTKNSLNDPVQFIQDIFFTATYFITVLASIGLIYSGYLYIVAGGDDPKKVDQAKKGFKFSLIGILIVIFSVVIVRVIQFIAAGGYSPTGLGGS